MSHPLTHAATWPLPQRQSAPDSSDYDTMHSKQARQHLGTYGLMPPAIESYATQSLRCMRQLEMKTSSIEKYSYLSSLRNNNTHLFYRLALDNMKTMTPLIYTPVVGEACLRWSEIYQQPEGLYLSYADKGNILSVLQNWPQDKVEITVVTDGSRILGLGDLGINGMGIPVGKLALYSACGGIQPKATLPLTVDLGTSNMKYREDPLYMGARMDKVTAEQEAEYLDELMDALTKRWPGICIQFEDWKNPFPSLERYQHKYCMFNDDIQGTGAVILGGIINAVKRAGIDVRKHRAVFLGAGSAAVGVAKQIVQFFVSEGLTEEEARRMFWLVDTKGLVTLDRGDKLADHKVYFARPDNEGAQFKTLEEVVEYVKPTMLMGLSTIGGAFTTPILEKMGAWNEKPIIFPLSNPSVKSECTFEAALAATQGRCLFASGSPFDPAPHPTEAGKMMTPGQGNNMYVFPGIGLAAILAKAVHVTQEMIYASGASLADALNDAEIADNQLYPDLDRIRDVSITVCRGVIRQAQKDGVTREPELARFDGDNAGLEAWIAERMYDPHRESEIVEGLVRKDSGVEDGVKVAETKLAAAALIDPSTNVRSALAHSGSGASHL